MFATIRRALLSVVGLSILFCLASGGQTALAGELSPDDLVTSSTCNCCCAAKPEYNSGVGIHLPDHDANYYQELFTGTIAVATQQGSGDPTPWALQSVMIWNLTHLSSPYFPYNTTAPVDIWWNENSTPASEPFSATTWNVSTLGDNYGVTLDNNGNIYVAATRIYFTSRASTLGTGTANQRAGVIAKLANGTGTPSLFVQLPNDGNGIGNVYFDCGCKSVLATNFYDGLIYEMDANGNIAYTWDHGANLATAVDLLGNNLGRSPILGKDGTSSYAALGRRPWAVRVHNHRVYYSIWSQNWSLYSQIYRGTQPTEIWSVGLDSECGIVGPARLEVTLPTYSVTTGTGRNLTNPVADLSFGPQGTMIVAEKSMLTNNMASAHNARVLEFDPGATAWTLLPANYQRYKVGLFTSGFVGSNSGGGIDYDQATGRVSATGDALHYQSFPPYDNVYGIQHFPRGGGNRTNSVLTDLNDYDVYNNKYQVGDVKIPCPPADVHPLPSLPQLAFGDLQMEELAPPYRGPLMAKQDVRPVSSPGISACPK